MKTETLAAFILCGGLIHAAEKDPVINIGNLADGEKFTVAVAGTNGTAQSIANFHIEKTIKSLLNAPIGAAYAPPGEDCNALKSATKPEIVVKIPDWQTATAPQYWQRPRAVLLKRGTLEAIGFFSASKKFDTRKDALNYLSHQIGNDLRSHFKKEPMMYPRGNAEFSMPYKNGKRDLEIRFKCFALDGSEPSIILCYHGLSCGERSIDNEFRAFFGFVTE